MPAARHLAGEQSGGGAGRRRYVAGRARGGARGQGSAILCQLPVSRARLLKPAGRENAARWLTGTGAGWQVYFFEPFRANWKENWVNSADGTALHA